MFVMLVITFDCKVPVIQRGCLVVNTTWLYIILHPSLPLWFLEAQPCPPLKKFLYTALIRRALALEKTCFWLIDGRHVCHAGHWIGLWSTSHTRWLLMVNSTSMYEHVRTCTNTYEHVHLTQSAEVLVKTLNAETSELHILLSLNVLASVSAHWVRWPFLATQAYIVNRIYTLHIFI